MASISKKDALESCIAKAQMQLQDLRSAMQKVKESIEGEEKSSAGDKYETARAMAQKEMERLGPQLEKAKLDLTILSNIPRDSSVAVVQLGSLVQTTGMHLFLSIPLGRVTLKGGEIFAVSPSSPIGQAVLGKGVGESFTIGSKQDKIVAIS